MAERRVDRVVKILQANGGRMHINRILGEVQRQEQNPGIIYQTIYTAIQAENERLEQNGEPLLFRTSRNGEERGWVRLDRSTDLAPWSVAEELSARILEANRRVDEEIRSRLEQMDWRTFESSFLTTVLEKLGFQDVEITQATRDGGVDARVKYNRGVVVAHAMVSAKHWKSTSAVGVDEVRKMRGIPGNEDTAVIVTTGRFSKTAQDEAVPSQNLRVVYLIDGDQLVAICKAHGIGVKKQNLPAILVLDEEQFGVASAAEEAAKDPEDASDKAADGGSELPTGKQDWRSRPRFREAWIGDTERGLSAADLSALLGLGENTVRTYLSTGKRSDIAERIRADAGLRARAIELVWNKRAG